MNLEELITKWTEQIAMHRRVVGDPLMWTKEDRLKSSHQTQALCAIMNDIKNLNGETVKREQKCHSVVDNDCDNIKYSKGCSSCSKFY